MIGALAVSNNSSSTTKYYRENRTSNPLCPQLRNIWVLAITIKMISLKVERLWGQPKHLWYDLRNDKCWILSGCISRTTAIRLPHWELWLRLGYHCHGADAVWNGTCLEVLNWNLWLPIQWWLLSIIPPWKLPKNYSTILDKSWRIPKNSQEVLRSLKMFHFPFPGCALVGVCHHHEDP